MNKNFNLSIALSALLCLFISNAHAGFVTTTLEATVDAGVGSNPYGIMDGQTAVLSFTYDDTDVAMMGPSDIFFDGTPGRSMSFSLGSLNLSETDDVGFGDPDFGPAAFFEDGDLTGFQFFFEEDFASEFFILEIGEDLGGGIFFILDEDISFETRAEGTFIISEATTAPVPVGPALPLFLSALSWLGFSIRKKSVH